jgi:hypothetical protein
MRTIALIALLLVQALEPHAQLQAQGQVQLGTVVRPETTTVGQHFVATIRVRVPAGTQVRFPARPDSSAQVDSAGAVARTDSTVGGFTQSTVSYVLAAWDTGAQRVGLDSVVVVTAGTERTAAINGFQVYVRSVLPRDTALRKPKPFRPVVAVAAFNWTPWLIAAALAILAALLLAVWRRWRRRRALGLTPLEIAERDFARIESQRLIESGESERYAIEMAAVMRGYLARVVPAAAQSATTHELALSLRHTTVVPLPQVLDVLDATDLIKFARERSSAERAREIVTASRGVVAQTAAAVAAAATAAATTAAASRAA